MDRNSTLIFVCEHGAAKSIVAAAYFNRFATQRGLNVRAVARGTNPDQEVSPQTVIGLAKDGLAPTESTPQKLTEADLQSAQRVIAFCELPDPYRQHANIERWADVPPVSEDYERARNVIVSGIRQMLEDSGKIIEH
jgi:protein-tyrosine-phosphatase